jgi:hypothetical protein
MNANEAVAMAKKHFGDVFSAEQIQGVGLEEVEFEDANDVWSVTIGFSRADVRNPMAIFVGGQRPDARVYKIVRIKNADGVLVSIRNRPIDNLR